MLGTCNTCVTLQSRVTSSGATVNSWMIFWCCYLSFFSFLSFACLFCLFLFCGCWFCFYFLLAYFLLCAFKFAFFFSSLFILCAVFISLWVGLGLIFCWSENKISYFGVVYKFLSVGMELAVIKELFIILYIYYIYFLTNLFWFFYIYLFIYWLIYCNFSESLCCDCIFVCAIYLPSIYVCY